MISICYITARLHPEVRWFFESLRLQSGLGDVGEIIIVDFFSQECDGRDGKFVESRKASIMSEADGCGFYNLTKIVPPKPNVWGGQHRLTKNNWWHVAACRNTGLIYASHSFIAFLDDRCVLSRTWLDAVREAQESSYMVCGAYEKRVGMTVLDGVIQHGGTITGEDSRLKHCGGHKLSCPGTWVFGCTFALPVEKMLEVNGVDESWDSVSMEDTHFGQMIQNIGYPIFYDPRMMMTEDRSPEFSSHNMLRSSKEKHSGDQNDKTHTLIKKLWHNKIAAHPTNLKHQKELVLSGVPIPSPSSPTHDWFDGQPLSEM